MPIFVELHFGPFASKIRFVVGLYRISSRFGVRLDVVAKKIYVHALRQQLLGSRPYHRCLVFGNCARDCLDGFGMLLANA